VAELWRSLRSNRRLLRDFVVRDLKGRYVGSSMGFFWSVVFPLINLAVYTFVFHLVLNMRWGGQRAEQVILSMFAGILVWSAFAESVSRSTNTLVENQNLIQKVVFPSEILPVYLALSAWVNLCIGLVVVVLGVLWLGYLQPLAPPAESAADFAPLRLGAPYALLPALFALQIVFTLGLGYLMATLNLFARDTFHLIGVLLTVWMFATPIFYPSEMVTAAGFAWVLEANPMHWLIQAYRDVLLWGVWPEPALLGRFALVAAALFLLGISVFLRNKRSFPDLL
jgi:ABC-type polysaccharide/polyol phosphate export permease